MIKLEEDDKILKQQVKYIVVGQNNDERMNFIYDLNIQRNKSQALADNAPIFKHIKIKDRQDCKVEVTMIDMPMNYIKKLKDYASSDCKAIIAILRLPKRNIVQIPNIIIREYCKILQEQIDNNEKNENLMKLIVCFYQSIDTNNLQDVELKIYKMIENNNKKVVSKIPKEVFDQIIIDKTGSWKLSGNMKNLELIRTHLKSNNFTLKQSLNFKKLQMKIKENQEKQKREQAKEKIKYSNDSQNKYNETKQQIKNQKQNCCSSCMIQ